ncbi:MAG: AraC family transcriptional regulator [Muribaculaceae bacterium]|nr:AraC family transcriptional regulator [Muribaculaceae bacterium]
MEQKLNLKDITQISDISESFSHAEEDYIFSHFVYNDTCQRDFPDAIRFDGVTVLMVLKGNLKINIGHREMSMNPGSLTVISPDDVISSSTTDGDCEFYALFLSLEFMKSLNIDTNIMNPGYMIDREPILRMSDDETLLVSHYLQLMHRCAINNNNAPKQLSIIGRSIGRNIVVALLYQFMLIVEKEHLLSVKEKKPHAKSRKLNYVHDFMNLLREHYQSERTVAFYAGKLCISPKYLSLLVRDVTGHSAAEIIDRFVINEAKNMLRFSGFTIQQVAYKLNFPNQSAFGKYFKHLTGQSPTAFRSN